MCATRVVFKGTGTIWLRCPVTSESGALQMFFLTELGQPLEISLERLSQCVSLYVPLSKGTRITATACGRIGPTAFIIGGRSWR